MIDRTLTTTEVLDEVTSRGLLANAQVAPDQLSVLGELDVDGQRVGVRVRYSSALSLPEVRLDPPDALGMLPHLDDILCYQEKEGLVIDRRDPGGVLEFALNRARTVLLEGVEGTNATDFAAEFATIWNRRPEMETMLSFLPPERTVEEVAVISVGKTVAVTKEEDELRRFFGGDLLKASRNLRRAIYVPLEPAFNVMPPPPRGDMWTPDQVRKALLPAVSEDNTKILSKWLRGRAGKSVDFVFFGLPTGHGGDSLFGIKFIGCGDVHPLLNGGTAERVSALRLRRFDQGFLAPRGGANEALASKRVLVVGCGAVGGIIATEVARSGVGHLDLVDGDTLSEENTYRHVLGQKHWHDNKAAGLESIITDNVPYISVDGIPKTLHLAMQDGDVELPAYDLIFAATGDVTLEMDLNERIILEGGPPTVFAWVEPLGIGGHAMLVRTDGGGGCYECAYTSIDDPSEDLRRDRLSFAHHEQDREFGRELSGCGSLHTPFASLDATRTAVLAVALGLCSLSGREQHNVVESWRGDPRAFLEAGFRTSARFDSTAEELAKQRMWKVNPRCRVCGPA